MNRLKTVVLFSLVLVLFAHCNNVEQDTRPNILIILADDLGYADLSIHGSKDCLTPNIDLIATQGVQCLTAYVSAPQCSPSRAGLMTGRYQNRFGHEANPEIPFVQTFGLDVGQKTFGRFMKDEGYDTHFFGKWDLGSIPSAQPWTRGFDYFFGHYAGARSFFIGDKLDPVYQRLRKSPTDKTKYMGYLTDLITDDAIDQLARKDGKPWFTIMSYLTPHWPMEPKPEDFQKHIGTRDMHRRAFLGLMDNLDFNVGKLLEHLEESGQADNTIVIFLSDNGAPTGAKRKSPNQEMEYGKNTSLNNPFKGVKGELFEGGIRTPFFIKYPKVLEPGKFPHPVTSLDLLPTCLAVAGGTPDRELDGKNILPYLSKEVTGKPHQTLYWRWFNQWAILHNNWKLVIVDHDKRMLYNMKKDPYEKKNLIKKHPKIYNRMLKNLKSWNNELKPADWRYPEQIRILSRPLE